MKVSSVHITLTPLDFESRTFKQANSIAEIDQVGSIKLFGIKKSTLKLKYPLDKKIEILKFKKSNFPNWVNYFLYLIYIIRKIDDNHTKIFHIHSVKTLPYIFPLKIVFKNSKIVYDTHELETETMGLKGLRKLFMKMIEKIFINHVDLSVFVNDAIKNWYLKNYKTDLNSVVVYNAPNENWGSKRKQNIFREKKYVENKLPIILYQGFLTYGRGIENMILNINKLKKNKFNFMFMGYGPLESLIVSSSKKNNHIIFIPSVDASILPVYTSSADYGIALNGDKCLSYRFSLSNKFFEYSASALPIIVCSNLPIMKNLIEKYKSGYVLNNDSFDEFETVLNSIEKSDYKNYSNNSLNMFKKFSWGTQSQNYKHNLKKIIDANM